MRYCLILILFWVGNCSPVGRIAQADDKRPNILFCMADDWGWPHAGVYGDQAVRTPSFDRLAREGTLFHHVYVSSPSCTPSRNAVITGKYHWQLGPGANLHSTLPTEHESFVHMLRDNGYVTGRSTKKQWGPGKIQSWQAHHGDHPVTKLYPNIANFLDNTDAGKQPFFYWLATSDPHRPYAKGSGKKAGIDSAKAHMFAHYPDVDEIRNDVADYYFEVERWDSLVGKAIEELEKRKLLENTIIIMTGDHGMPFPRCKGNLYDCGTRVPFAVRWPAGATAGRKVNDFISLTDVGPTLLELTGTAVPDNMTGRSFAGLLRQEGSGILDPRGRPDIVFGRERHVPAQEAPNMNGYPSRALRTREYLYIRNYKPDLWPAGAAGGNTNYPNQWLADCDGGPTKDYIYQNRDRDEVHRRAYRLCFAKRPAEELYFLADDPDQLENVIEDPKHAAALESLRQRLVERLTELNDPRAKDPDSKSFDGFPYYGGGGGKKLSK